MVVRSELMHFIINPSRRRWVYIAPGNCKSPDNAGYLRSGALQGRPLKLSFSPALN
jgi:hypothetical protein